MFGEVRLYLVTLIVLGTGVVNDWAADRGICHAGIESLVQHSDVIAQVEHAVDDANHIWVPAGGCGASRSRLQSGP